MVLGLNGQPVPKDEPKKKNKNCLWNFMGGQMVNKFTGQPGSTMILNKICPEKCDDPNNPNEIGCDYWNTEKKECNIVLAVRKYVNS